MGLDLAAILGFVVLSRLWVVPPVVMGGDGPEYINALKLDATYSVPPPGNVGYVLCAKVVSLVVSDPIWMYAIVDIVLSCVAGVALYRLGREVLPRAVAVAATFATLTSVQAWAHGVIMQSYIVWLAMFPMIALYVVRMVKERESPRWRTVVCAAGATGVSTILRQDMVVFAGPLLGMGLLLGRARVGMWATAAGICAACCFAWLWVMAEILGSVQRYVEVVRGKYEWHENVGSGTRGIAEGLVRNLVKYWTFMAWTAHAALVLAGIGVWKAASSWRATWRGLAIGAAWALPSLYYAWVMFTGTAGLVLITLPLVYGAAAFAVMGFGPTTGDRGRARRAAMVMGAIAVMNAAQFLLTPIPRPTDQRVVLLTHMFFGYTAAGLRSGYVYELQDFGIDKSLKNTVKQFLSPEPVPRVPEGLQRGR